MSQLEKIIFNLKSKPEVDAVFITGSSGIGSDNANSDIDLGIIMNTGSDIKSLFQWVDDKPCEVHIFLDEEIKQILDKDSISPNDPEGLIVGLLEKADIKFDKTGVLSSYKNNYENIARKLRVPENKKIWFNGVINWAYIINKRYFDSNDSEYLEALEMRLPGDISLLVKAYFEFRNIPWKGEKHVVRYLKSSDIEFYLTYKSYFKASTVEERYCIYTKLLSLVFYGEYGLWDKDIVYPSARDQSRLGQENLIMYWNDLVS